MNASLAPREDERYRRMQTFLSDGLWAEIDRLVASSRYKVAAVAFATNDELMMFGKGDLLIVDASDQAIKTRKTDVRMLKRAFRRGAKLHSCPGLHAKVFILDDVAVIGSANLSISSRRNLIEAAIITDEPSSVAAVRSFVEQLAKQCDEIGQPFLERIARLEIKRTGLVSRRRPGITTDGRRPQLWFAGLHDVDDDDEEKEQIAGWEKEAVEIIGPEQEFSRFWIKGRSRIRAHARPGDLVFQIWRENGKSKRPDAVYRPVPIRMIRDGEKKTWFFVEKRSNENETCLAWPKFLRELKTIGVRRRIGANSIQSVPLALADRLLNIWPR